MLCMFLVWVPLRGPAFLRFLGWGGVGGGVITFMSLACKVMRRICYVDVTLIILWCYVEEPLMLLLGWGGVGWGWGGVGGGVNNVHVSCVQGDATYMLRWRYVDHTLMLRWGAVDATVGVGWGGVAGGEITFMCLACKVMRRICYVDVALIILWCYVEEPLMLLLGWGGVGFNFI